MHETLSLAFLTASTAGILLLKPCALDSRILITAQILRSRTLFQTVSFGLEDILYTVASGSEDIGATSFDVFLPGSQEAWLSPAYPELVDVLARATEKLSLDWPDEPRESQSSKLDEHFLSGSGSRPMKTKLSFSLTWITRWSWKQPFSSHLTNAAAADFTNLIGSVEQGYAAVPAVEDTLAAHLSVEIAVSRV